MTARNAERNGVELETRLFRWDAAPEPLGPPWQLVLASDVLYEARNVAPLLALLPRLTAAAGEVWLADPGRAAAAGFLDGGRRALARRRDPPRRPGPRHRAPACAALERCRPRSGSLEVGLEARERPRRLALRGARHEHAAGHAAEHAARAASTR